MSLLIEADREEGYAGWHDVFRQVMPAMDIHWWNDPKVDPQDVEYVFCFDPEPGRLATFPNLRLICAASVGVERIVRDPSWSRSIWLRRGLPGESRCSWPTYSSSVRGRIRSASGRERSTSSA